MRTLSAVAVAGWIAAIGGAGLAPVRAQAGGSRSRHRDRSEHVHRPGVELGFRKAPLIFGIYPGGAAGTVGPGAAVKPEDPLKRLTALQQLRSTNGPLLVRLYAAYSGRGGPSAAQLVGREVTAYTRAGFDVELALTYRPRSGGSRADVAGFVRFAEDTVRSLGPNHRFTSLQVTNEANVGGAPNVADGYYAGARDALIGGVLAAKREIHRLRFPRVKVGFNWAYVTEKSEREFWSYLGRHGGRAFRAALDWVGFDVYPGTWGPPLGKGGLGAGTTRFIEQALGSLRPNLELARIPVNIPLHVSESGYPTGPGRTEAMQAESMRASIEALDAARRTHNITAYTWFDLRDANSASQSFQDRYGILHDDYSPKAAFALYRSLIAKLSVR